MRVFVYGTLIPGQVLYSLIKRMVATAEPAEVEGRLFMSPSFYPVYKRGDGIVTGQILTFKEEWDEADVLDYLDEIEGAPDLYTREIIEVDGSPVYIYAGNGAVCAKPIPSGDFVDFITSN